MIETASTSTPEPLPALAGLDEIVALLVQICRDRVRELTFRCDFPEPVAELAEGAVWFVADIEAWIGTHGDVLAEALRPS